MKINNLKKTVFSSLKITHNSAKNVQRGKATSLMIDALLFKKGEITKAHKEMIKDSYKDTIMKSYQTRIRDRAEVPRDPLEFQKAITRILRGQKNNKTKNFFLEQMLRILPSKNKLFKMNRLEARRDEILYHDATNSCMQYMCYQTPVIRSRTVFFPLMLFMLLITFRFGRKNYQDLFSTRLA